MHHSITSLVLAVLVLGYAVLSEQVNRRYIAPALIFMLLGMALGPRSAYTCWRSPGDRWLHRAGAVGTHGDPVQPGGQTSPQPIRLHGPVALRLLVVGIPVSATLGALTAAALLPVLPWWRNALAAIVAPTEVALIEALLDDRRIPRPGPGMRRRWRALASDGFALAIPPIAPAWLSQRSRPGRRRWAWFIFSTEIFSLVAGAVWPSGWRMGDRPVPASGAG